MSQNITLLGAQYSDVPSVALPKTGGGTASFTDVTDTTAAASDVASGKYFFTANGVLTLGTNQGSSDGYVWQDESGYVHLSDEKGTQPIYDTLNVSSSGTFTPATGHAYNSVVVPSGTATAPNTISGTSASVSTGTNTLTLTKTVSVTPSVTTAGYVSSGTAGNSSVSLTASVNTRSSSDLSASNLTVTAPSGYYTSNATKTLSDANLVAGNVKKDVTIFGVTGSYEGGGGISGVATGTLTVPSIKTSTVTIVSEAEIGFVPTKFMFYKNEDTTTDKAIRAATYIGIGTTYIRTRSTYSGQNAVATTSANYTEWTSSSSGHLYKDASGTISISASSLYNLTAGTYTWWAME